MGQLRYGLLGAGMMGQEHLRNLALIPDIDVTCVVETDPGMRQRTAQLLPEAAFLDDIDALRNADIDAVVVATPNYQHADQLIQLFERTDLAILCEKPLVTTPDDVLRISEAAAKHEAPVWVGMEYRYMPPLAAFRERLPDVGDLKMLTIREHRYPFLKKVGDWNRFNRNSGGTLVEKCCHFFDLMRLLVDDEAVRVMASGAQDHNHLKESYDDEVPDIWDNAFVIVDFRGGRRALLDLCMFAEGSLFEQELTATGPKGKMECFIPGPRAIWGDNTAQAKIVHSPRLPAGPVTTLIETEEQILAAGSHQGSTFYEHQAFKAACLGEQEVGVSVSDGLKAVVIGMAAQHAAIHHKVVEISEDGLSFGEVA